jgi:hypothetical protein
MNAVGLLPVALSGAGGACAWRFGAGDPTPIGWGTTAAYLAAAALCWLAFSAEARAARSNARFWLALALALLALGVNKELDLHTLAIEGGRALARALGWQHRRHEIPVVFTFFLVIAGAIAMLYLARSCRPVSAGRLLGLLGLVGLLGYVVMRLAVFFRVPIFLDRAILEHSWIMEVAAVALIGLGGIVDRRAGGGLHRPRQD